MARTSRPVEVHPHGVAGVLPGADFTDAWRIDGLVESGADAVARRAFARAPGWVTALLALRTVVVKPFGLKSGRESSSTPRIGLFPLISQEPGRVVMGMDDRHLDFRLVVDVTSGDGEDAAAIATTLVRTHNLGGRLYLAVITPFHRLIVPAMLARAQGRSLD